MTDGRVVILSIEKGWARAILNHRKLFEYRKVPPAIDTPYRILLYATRGPSAIWGEAVVDYQLETDIENLLFKTISDTPHQKGEIREYFNNERGTALHLSDITEYSIAISVEEIRDVVPEFHSPQNFRYIEQEQYQAIRRKVS